MEKQKKKGEKIDWLLLLVICELLLVICELYELPIAL